MIRISTKNELRGVTITIDGQLAGADVDAVEKCCAEAAALGRRVLFFLREVSNIDMRGQQLLTNLASAAMPDRTGRHKPRKVAKYRIGHLMGKCQKLTARRLFDQRKLLKLNMLIMGTALLSSCV